MYSNSAIAIFNMSGWSRGFEKIEGPLIDAIADLY